MSHWLKRKITLTPQIVRSRLFSEKFENSLEVTVTVCKRASEGGYVDLEKISDNSLASMIETAELSLKARIGLHNKRKSLETMH
jgi:hypothetical protein